MSPLESSVHTLPFAVLRASVAGAGRYEVQQLGVGCSVVLGGEEALSGQMGIRRRVYERLQRLACVRVEEQEWGSLTMPRV